MYSWLKSDLISIKQPEKGSLTVRLTASIEFCVHEFLPDQSLLLLCDHVAVAGTLTPKIDFAQFALFRVNMFFILEKLKSSKLKVRC